MVYDQRILSWKRLEQVSLLTLKGCILVPIRIGNYQKARINRIRGQANLILRDRKFCLATVIEATEASQYDAVGVLGVDLGIVNLAVDSDGNTYRGEGVEEVMLHTERLKAKLQACGSKSAKRHLKHLSGHEARCRRNMNHVVSKCLVAKALGTGCAIALEDLRGIRAQTTVRKVQHRRHNSWSFHQLRSFIEYKAKLVGVAVRLVNPRGTSHTCPQCGPQANRNRPTRSRFICVRCGLAGPADYIAALNIAARGIVSSPIVPKNTFRNKPKTSIVGS
jgi:IS605 OrfB family transposase